MMWRVKQLADPDGVLGPGRRAQPRPGRAPAQPQVDARDRGGRRPSASSAASASRSARAQRDHDAAPADRAAPRDGAPAGGLAGARGAARAVRVRRDRDLRRRRLVQRWPARWRSTPASSSRSCARAQHSAARGARRARAGRALRRVGRARRRAAGRSRARRRAALRARAARRVDAAGARRPSCPLPPTREGAAAVYLPACINRIFGNARGRAGAPVAARGAGGDLRARRAAAVDPGRRRRALLRHCRGARRATRAATSRWPRATAAALRRWTDDGELPVVIDASSCAHGLIARTRARSTGVRGRSTRSRGSTTTCSSAWRSRASSARVAVHPTCAGAPSRPGRASCGDRRARSPTRWSSRPPPAAAGWPATAGCCTPSCPPSALRDVAAELDGPLVRRAACRATAPARSRCSRSPGRPYASFVLALEELTRDERPSGPVPPAGLCDSCRHQQIVRNTRGSVFSLCRRSRTEPDRFPRYPRLPVTRLPGLRAATEAEADPGRSGLLPS